MRLRATMDRNESHEQQFSPGNIVWHHNWGAGRVLEVKDGPQGSVVVDFPRKPRHQVSFQVAVRALSRLPSDGLEALLLDKPDNITQWSRSAPLKLIGLTLTDLGEAARPADLRKKLDRGNLSGVKWKSWWKRVQPDLRQSPHFRVHSDGTYQLVSRVDQIPETPLASAPKRLRRPRISDDQLQELASKLQSGETSFESIKDGESLRLVAKEVIRRGSASQAVRTAITRALAGPVQRARIILEELSASGHLEESVDALVQFTRHLEGVAASPTKGKSKAMGKHVRAKACLLEDAARRLALHRQLDKELPLVSSLIKAILGLSLAIWRKEMSNWRSESVDCLSKAVAILGEKQPEVYDIAGEYLATHESNTAGRLDLTESLLSKVTSEEYPNAVDRFLMGSLAGSPEFVAQCFSQHIARDLQFSWISSALSRLLSRCDSHAIDMLAKLLLKTWRQVHPQDLRACAQLAIAIASIRDQVDADLSRIITEGLWESQCAGVLESKDRTLRDESQTILGSIEAAYETKLDKEREQFEALRASMESEIQHLGTALEAANAESRKRKALVEQLKSSYRLPQRWASFQGKKEVLESLTRVYQEAFLSGDPTDLDAKFRHWLLLRLEGILQKHAISKFGQIDNVEIYDPALYEYIPGLEGSGKEVRIRCHGFEWRDPAGNKIILARAKVSGC